MFRIRVANTETYVNVTIGRQGIVVCFVSFSCAARYDTLLCANAVNVLRAMGIETEVERCLL